MVDAHDAARLGTLGAGAAAAVAVVAGAAAAAGARAAPGDSETVLLPGDSETVLLSILDAAAAVNTGARISSGDSDCVRLCASAVAGTRAAAPLAAAVGAAARATGTPVDSSCRRACDANASWRSTCSRRLSSRTSSSSSSSARPLFTGASRGSIGILYFFLSPPCASAPCGALAPELDPALILPCGAFPFEPDFVPPAMQPALACVKALLCHIGAACDAPLCHIAAIVRDSTTHARTTHVPSSSLLSIRHITPSLDPMCGSHHELHAVQKVCNQHAAACV